MAKFCGMIGFATTAETRPGIWESTIVEHRYKGDIIEAGRLLQPTDQVNDDINVTDKISIIADAFAFKNVYTMKYAVYMGAKWKVKNVSVKHPRLILTLGGLYNGK